MKNKTIYQENIIKKILSEAIIDMFEKLDEMPKEKTKEFMKKYKDLDLIQIANDYLTDDKFFEFIIEKDKEILK